MSPGKPVTQSLSSHPSPFPFPKPFLEWPYRGVLCAVCPLGIGVSRWGKQTLDPRDGRVEGHLPQTACGLMETGSELAGGGVCGSCYPLQPEERSRKQANKTWPCNLDGAVQGPAEVVGIMRAHGAPCTALDSFQSTFTQTCSLQQMALLGSVCGDAGARLSTVK